MGIGFFLSQKHCNCTALSPGCCKDGWKLILAGSRFLKPAEARYAPIEGEALAIAWSLEQTKYFTQGCDNLLVITDHKPLVKLLGNRTLDEIINPRLFRIQQRTLTWRFTTEYMPGDENKFSDATSRHPAGDGIDEILCISNTEIPAGLQTLEEEDYVETLIAPITDMEQVRAITRDLVKAETAKDHHMSILINMIETVFPDDKQEMSPQLEAYWNLRKHLFTIDGVVLTRDRVLIPPYWNS